MKKILLLFVICLSVIRSNAQLCISCGQTPATTSASATIGGGGTATYLPIWDSGTVLGNSIIQSNGSSIAINAAPSGGAIFQVKGGNGSTFLDLYTPAADFIISSTSPNTMVNSGNFNMILGTAGQDILSILNSNKFVGIGYNFVTPTAQLHVQGTTTTSATYALKIENSSSTNLFSIQDNGLLTGYITSGVYTPTLTNATNVDASTPYQCNYMRVGNVVTVSGKVDVDPTTTLTGTQLGMTLPIATDITAVENCGGTAYAPSIAGQGAAILGNASSNIAKMQWVTTDVTNQAMFFSFTYLIQ